MTAVVERVESAKVEVGGEIVGAIGKGLLVFCGMVEGDTPDDLALMADKLSGIRIFEDDQGRMNLSPEQAGASILLIPNFTLAADCRKGRRPSFAAAMRPDEARGMFERLKAALAGGFPSVQSGVFGADMRISNLAAGPVTIVLDTKRLKEKD